MLTCYIAQLVEHEVNSLEVSGSIPDEATKHSMATLRVHSSDRDSYTALNNAYCGAYMVKAQAHNRSKWFKSTSGVGSLVVQSTVTLHCSTALTSAVRERSTYRGSPAHTDHPRCVHPRSWISLGLHTVEGTRHSSGWSLVRVQPPVHKTGVAQMVRAPKASSATLQSFDLSDRALHGVHALQKLRTRFAPSRSNSCSCTVSGYMLTMIKQPYNLCDSTSILCVMHSDGGVPEMADGGGFRSLPVLTGTAGSIPATPTIHHAYHEGRA